jgi:hypothetical protein
MADDAIAQLPELWQAAWESPQVGDRPLQIVHEVNLKGKLPEGMDQLLPDATPDGIARRNLEYYRQRGLGGLVCNVSFRDYLQSEAHWAELQTVVEACRDLGLIVWIYDEKGYPSGGAGGLVLATNREFEAQELAYDASQPDPFVVRPSYEFTHASNNYHAARRYANLIDDRAVRCFLDVTHQAYFQRLAPLFGTTIQAAFTDEPSLIAVNLGQIPEEVRQRVPVVDPLDPTVKALPRVPWSYDIVERYRERYAEDLLAQRPSLFAGDTAEDRRVRRQFWSLVADLIADRYFGALERWCAERGIASSGHSLWEEAVLHHVPLEGNGLQCLSHMHIPGLDLLTSDPTAVIHSGWLTAGLPASAARLSGRRRVMTEVSDFSQKMGGQGPASLAAMQATAAWQAAWDVTDFTLYYSLRDRPADEYRQYCDFVGRLNAILKPATADPHVLLYYPIYDLWSEYVPVAEPLQLASQSPRAQQLVASFLRLGQMLQRRQIPLTLTDHRYLAQATVEADGTLVIGRQPYSALLVPHDAQLPAEAAEVVARFQQQGGRVLRDGVDSVTARPDDLARELQPTQRLEPACDHIACGRFVRDGQLMLLLVNVGQAQYAGQLQVGKAGSWVVLDPATGSASAATADTAGNLPVHLAGSASRILVRD